MTTTNEDLKEIVCQKYGEIARTDSTQGVNVDCGCGPSSCCGPARRITPKLPDTRRA